MSDLQILALFRLAQANGTIHKLTKTTHDCFNSSCDGCIARPACRAIVDADINPDFATNYRKWARRTPLLQLSDLQQQYPELFI